MELQKKYKELKGTRLKCSGNVFSAKKALPEMEYLVLDIRIGEAMICDPGKTYRHPTYELLLWNEEAGSRVKWSRPFPIREINFVDTPPERPTTPPTEPVKHY